MYQTSNPNSYTSNLRNQCFKLRSLWIVIFALGILGCSGKGNFEVGGSSNGGSVESRVEFSSPNMSETVNVNAPAYDGETSASFQFCSLKIQPGCNPSAGESVSLSVSGGSFQGSIDIATSSLTPGDILKYLLTVTDSQGSDRKEYGYLLIPHDGSVPRTIRQFGRFSYDSFVNKAADDYLQVAIRGSDGSLYLAGYSNGNFGEPNGGGADAVVVKLSPDGKVDPKFAVNGVWHLGLGTFGASGNEHINALALDEAGNLFVAGNTESSLSGTNAGGYDGFVIKMDAKNGLLDSNFGDGDGADNDGVLQINASNASDASSNEELTSLSFDGLGNLFVAGHTGSSLSGTNAGGYDGFVVKIDAINGFLDSNFGDGDGLDNDGILQINGTNTSGATSDEYINAMAYESGKLFLAGWTRGAISGVSGGWIDSFVIKLDASNGVLDSNFGDGDGSDNDGILQINASNATDASERDVLYDMSLDGAGNIFIAGSTDGDLSGSNAGMTDIFVIKMNSTSGSLDPDFGDGDGVDNDGILQINASNASDASDWDNAYGITLDGVGNLYITGQTYSSLSGTNAGSGDGFIVKVNASSGELDLNFGDGDGSNNDGILQINANNASDASGYDIVYAITLDSVGNLYIAGESESSLSGINAGGRDWFVSKISSSSGELDSNFGDGDGSDNDGILQLNESEGLDATNYEHINAMALDNAGNLFVAGYIETYSGLYNAYVMKMDASSGVLDSEFGDGDGSDNDGVVLINGFNSLNASGDQEISSIALDGLGNLFVAGYTSGPLSGADTGSSDGFVIKMDATSGVFDSDFGDGDGSDNDGIMQINSGNVVDASGYDFINSIVLDGAGNLFAAGHTRGSLSGGNGGDSDGFVIKMSASSGVFDSNFGDGDGADNDGILQINTNKLAGASDYEHIDKIIHDGLGNLFVVGTTTSSLSGTKDGMEDGFVIKMDGTNGLFDSSFGDGDGVDGDGVLQINASNTSSTGSRDGIASVALDGAGNLFVAGYTQGTLSGANGGYFDAFVIKMSAESGLFDATFGDGDGVNDDGILQINASKVTDASLNEWVSDIVLDGTGNLFIAGSTSSSLSGANAGDNDGFIIKMEVTNGLFDSSFGDGDGADNDGILQINASNTLDASGYENVTSIALDGAGNIFVGGYTESSLDGNNSNGGEYDSFTLMLDVWDGQL